MDRVRLGEQEVSRFLLGSNPFSGFSHQSPETDMRMQRYYTAERIKQTLKEAEAAGVTGMVGRLDAHMCRLMLEYRNEGGSLCWFGQSCPEYGEVGPSLQRALRYDAQGMYVHGGYVDMLLAQDRIEELIPVVDRIHEAGLTAGIAGHNPDVFRWAEKRGLEVDFYMCCYYNSAHRDERAEHVPGQKEWFLEEDRRIMTDLIQDLSRPVIHYKIMAAGRNDPRKAFRYAAQKMRPGDAVCVGVYTEEKPDMVAENVALLEKMRGKTS